MNKYMGGSTNEHPNLPAGVPTTRFYAGDAGDTALPPTYKILVLDSRPAGSSEFEWNHGHSCGVAIASSVSEIVYWLEYW